MLKNIPRLVKTNEPDTDQAAPTVKKIVGKALASVRMERLLGNTAQAIALGAEQIRATASDYNQLRYSKDVLAKHGISRPVMALLNRDNEMSDKISSVPATESLDVIPIAFSDKRHTAVMSDIDLTLQSEQAVVSGWIAQSASQVANFIDTAGYHLPSLRDELMEVQAGLTEVAPTDSALAAVQVYNVAADARKAQMASVNDVLANIGPVDMETLSASADYRTQVTTQLSQCCDTMKDFTGVTRDGFDITRGVDLSTENMDHPSTLLALGYTPAACQELVNSAISLLDVLDGVVLQKDALIEGLTQAQAATPSVVLTAQAVEASTESAYTLTDHRQLINGYVQVFTAAMDCAVNNVIGVMAAGRAMMDCDPNDPEDPEMKAKEIALPKIPEDDLEDGPLMDPVVKAAE